MGPFHSLCHFNTTAARLVWEDKISARTFYSVAHENTYKLIDSNENVIKDDEVEKSIRHHLTTHFPIIHLTGINTLTQNIDLKIILLVET